MSTPTGTPQTSPDPSDTAHLCAGERITLDELAIHLSAAAVWLGQVARAAETPTPAVELAEMISSLTTTADHLARHGETIATLDAVIGDGVPLATVFYGGKPWGAAVADAKPDRYGKPPTVLTPAQIDHLRHQAQMDPDTPTTSYLAGIDGTPGLDRFESKHAATRRAIEREKAINATALALACPTCGAEPGAHCRTKTGRIAELRHVPRTKRATDLIDTPATTNGDHLK